MSQKHILQGILFHETWYVTLFNDVNCERTGGHNIEPYVLDILMTLYKNNRLEALVSEPRSHKPSSVND